MNLITLTVLALSMVALTVCDVQQTEATLLVNSRPILGEGANYDTRRKVLFWIDITGKSVHMYNPKTNQDKYFVIDQMVGFIVLSKSGDGLIMGLKEGIAFGKFKYQDGEVSGIDVHMMKRVEAEKEHNRFNDGKCDPRGNLWGGTMELDCQRSQGNLYSFRYRDSSLNMTKVIPDTTISNGIVWSKDQRTMYWIETIDGSVYAFDYDIETMRISNKRVAYKAAQGAGSPDGMTIDSHDKLWVAHYGGSRVSRVDPQTGSELFRVNVPLAQQTTSCSFGGDDLTDLYITTGSQFLSDDDKRRYPNSGGLFKVDLRSYFESVGNDLKGTEFARFSDL